MAFGNDAPDVLRKLRDRYEPIRELGRGRLGAVWLAREKAGGRLVAIKVLRPPQQDEAILDRLADAVRDAGRLVHPNIVRVHELRRAPGDGAIAIVSQHVQGPTLKDVLRREAPLDPARVESIMRDLAQALGHAHSYGVLHGDLRPSNIFLDKVSGHALLADFSVCRVLAELATDAAEAGAMLGVPAYMAPERLEGGPVDGRSDIYSLGLVMWEALSGRRPWDGESFYRVLHLQRHEELPRLTTMRSDIPTNLLFAIEGALHKFPDTRWANVEELVAQLDERDVGTPRARSAGAPVAIPAIPAAAATSAATSAASEPPPSAPARPPAGVERRSRLPDPEPAVPPRPIVREPVTTGAGVAAIANAPSAARVPPPPIRGRRALKALGLAVPLVLAIGIGSVMFGGGGGDDRDPPAAAERVADTSSGAVDVDAAGATTEEPAREDPALEDSAARARRDAQLRARVDSMARARRDSLAALADAERARRDTSGFVTGSSTDTTSAAVRDADDADDADAEPPEATPVVRADSAAGGSPCETPGTATQRACLLDLIDENDVQLNRAYQELITLMKRRENVREGDEEPPSVRMLRGVQREWLQTRDAACRGSAGGDPLWARATAPCYRERSEQRTREIRAQIARLRDGGGE